MKNSYSTYLLMLGLLVAHSSAMATGIPVYGFGEIVGQKVDEAKSAVVSDTMNMHEDIIKEMIKSVGGDFDPNALKTELQSALSKPVGLVTGQYEGLKNVLGEASQFGKMEIKKAGESIGSVKERVTDVLAVPAKREEQQKMTTEELAERAKQRAISEEVAATTGLAKSWLAEANVSNVAKTLENTQEELDNAQDIPTIMGSIVRLQEETQKNVNTRLSIMADNLMLTGYEALENSDD